MDAHVFRRCCDAFLPLLIGARVEKVQDVVQGTLVLTVYGGGHKRHLCCRFGRKEPFCFLTEHRISVDHPPSAAIMRLRKYAVGRRIAACVPQWCLRRLWLLLSDASSLGWCPSDTKAGSSSALPWLLLDLREGLSLHFLSEDATPEREEIRWPDSSELAAALTDWRSWPVLTPALRRTLSHLDDPEQAALLEDLRVGGGDLFCYALARDTGTKGRICCVSAWPLPLAQQSSLLASDGTATNLCAWNSADIVALLEKAGQELVLARQAQEQAQAAAVPWQRRTRRLQKLLASLQEDAQRLTAMTQCQVDALALQGQLWRWPADYRTATVHVDAGSHGPARDIALDSRCTVRENMTKFFHTARRGQRGLEHLAHRRAALEEELTAVQARVDGFSPGKAALNTSSTRPLSVVMGDVPKNVQCFVSSDGFTLLRGRDAKGNLAVRKLAAGHDIWLHAENGPGAHVIIRRAHNAQEVPERTLDEAGSLAALKSWQKDADRARIQYAEVRHVKPLRNAPAGTVRIDKSLPSRDVPVDATVEERLAIR